MADIINLPLGWSAGAETLVHKVVKQHSRTACAVRLAITDLAHCRPRVEGRRVSRISRGGTWALEPIRTCFETCRSAARMVAST